MSARIKKRLVVPATLVVSVLAGAASVAAVAACSSTPQPEPLDCFCEAVDAGTGPDAGPTNAVCTGPDDPKFKDPYWQCSQYA